MPRNLQEVHDELTAQTLDGMPDLSAQPAAQSINEERSAAMDAEPGLHHGGGAPIEGVKVYPKALTLRDVDACCILEEAAFPPAQRCSREKFIYRITVAPELCHGLFTTSSEDYESHHLTDAETARAAHSVESSSPRKQILIAHAIGTLSTNATVRDDDMALPPSWDAPSKAQQDPRCGHKPAGRVAMLHSLAVLPAYQGKRVGSTMLKGYIDLLRASENYDRLALLADASHVEYYEKRGFENLGKSEARFGGVDWFDMVMDFENEGGLGADDA